MIRNLLTRALGKFRAFVSSLWISRFFKALRARKQALWECQQARREIDGSFNEILGVYQAHSLPILAGAAGVGLLFARLRVGAGLMRIGVRIAVGPAWRLLRQVIARMA
jgi:hypothetical protein